MELSRKVEGKTHFWAIVSHRGTDFVQLECPVPFTWTDHFTIFWRGRTNPDNLYKFVRRSLRSQDEMLGTLFFFDHIKLRLPAYSVETIPSPLEKAVVEAYGDPRFLRFEVYPKNILTDDLHQARYVVWAAIASRQQIVSSTESKNEIGLFTTLGQLETERIDVGLQTLILDTIRPDLEAAASGDLLKISREILKTRLV